MSERRRRESNGGAEGDRTPDLVTASHALSQLSYGPISRETPEESVKTSSVTDKPPTSRTLRLEVAAAPFIRPQWLL